MIKKRMLYVLFISALALAVLGCGEADTKETGKVTVDNTVSKDRRSNEVEEYKDYMRFLDIGEEQTPIDEEMLNSKSVIDSNTGTIKPIFLLEIPEAVDVFNNKGFCIGYTKENIKVEVVAQNENWTKVDLQDGRLYIKTPDLENAKIIEFVAETESTEENETVISTEEVLLETEEDSETDFTITELNQVMYAKETVNTRSGPGIEYEKVGSISANQEVTVTGQADTGWYRVEVNGVEMYVSDSYLFEPKLEAAIKMPMSQKTTNNGTAPSTSEETPVEGTPSLPDVETITNDIKSAIISMGVRYYPDSDIYSGKYDLSGGMSWFEGRVATETYWDDVNGIASNYEGCKYFYIEYFYIDGNDIVFRCYWG